MVPPLAFLTVFFKSARLQGGARLFVSAQCPTTFARLRNSAFTLIEMIVVIAIMAILMALILPAFAVVGAKRAESVFSEMAGFVETARTHAMANNTYVYLGFVEYDGSRPAEGPQTAGEGRVVVAAVATMDGTRGYNDTSAAGGGNAWRSSYAKGANLVPVLAPQVYDNIDLVPLGTPPAIGSMARPDPGSDMWRVGGASFKAESQTPFSLPLGSELAGGKYQFDQVLIFHPDGSMSRQTVSTGQVTPLWVEIGIRPTVGNTANYAAISINGTTGASRIYRP